MDTTAILNNSEVLFINHELAKKYLKLALINDDISLIDLLYSNSIFVNMLNELKIHVLKLAIKMGSSLETFKYLLSMQQININQQTKDWYYQSEVSIESNILNYLLILDKNSEDISNKKILRKKQLEYIKNKYVLIKLLVEYNVDVNQQILYDADGAYMCYPCENIPEKNITFKILKIMLPKMNFEHFKNTIKRFLIDHRLHCWIPYCLQNGKHHHFNFMSHVFTKQKYHLCEGDISLFLGFTLIKKTVQITFVKWLMSQLTFDERITFFNIQYENKFIYDYLPFTWREIHLSQYTSLTFNYYSWLKNNRLFTRLC